MFNYNNNTCSISSNNISNKQHQRQNILTSADHHHEGEEAVADHPEYRSVNMSMNMNMNMNQNMMRSQQIATADTVDSLPLLSSIPMPQKSSLSSPLQPMPMSLPLPSKLFRITNPAASNKEGTLVPTSSPSPHHQWIIRKLHELPSDYVLVRTNVYVKQKQEQDRSLQPQLVADRICQTLKALSITVINDDGHPMIDPNSSPNPFIDDEGSSEEENVLFVETQDDVKFAIRLFSSNTMIVVEIQRTSGCTFAFRDAAKTILRSVSSANKQTRTGPGLAKRRFTIPLSLPKRSKEDLQKCIQDDFQIAYQMISSPNYETQVLGLESLEQLTRSAKKRHKSGSTEDEVKNVVARSVLGRGSGAVKDCDTDTPICDCLKQLLLLLDTTTATATNCQSSSSSSLLLRRKILTVLANSLEVINSNSTTCINTTDTTDRIVILHTMMKAPSFVSVLLSTLQETTPLRPHTAFPAVRCLRYLLLLSSSSLKGEEEEVVIAALRKIHPDAIAIVMSACSNDNDNDKGDCHYAHHHHHHHEGLEQESKMLMAQLQQKKSTMSL